MPRAGYDDSNHNQDIPDDCANPLLLGWIKEWLDTARQHNTKAVTTYKKAYESMRACPLTFTHPSEAQQLHGLGPKLCERLTEKLQQHCRDNGLPVPTKARKRKTGVEHNPSVDTIDVEETLPKRARKTKLYVPSLRSGPYALIKALATLDENAAIGAGMTKTQLIEIAQQWCDSSFSVPSEPGKFYTAWNSMKTLMGKDLVYERGRPTKKYALTEEGWEVANRMGKAEDNNKGDGRIVVREGGLETVRRPATPPRRPSKSEVVNLEDDDIPAPLAPSEVNETSTIRRPRSPAIDQQPEPDETSEAAFNAAFEALQREPGFVMPKTWTGINQLQQQVRERLQKKNRQPARSSAAMAASAAALARHSSHLLQPSRAGCNFKADSSRRKSPSEPDLPRAQLVPDKKTISVENLGRDNWRGEVSEQFEIKDRQAKADNNNNNLFAALSSPSLDESPVRKKRGQSNESIITLCSSSPLREAQPPSNNVRSRPISSQNSPVPNIAIPVTLQPEASSNANRTTPVFDPSIKPIFIPPNVFTIQLVLDNREVRTKSDREYISKELEKRGIRPLVRPLELGDCLWVAKTLDPSILERYGEDRGTDEILLDYIVERKRLDDLVGSIKDGRFREQKFRLRKSGIKNVIYVIEEVTLAAETATRYRDAVESAIASTQVVDGFFVKKTQKLDDTIRYLARMTKLLESVYKNNPLMVIPSKLLSPQNLLPLLQHFRASRPDTNVSITFPAFSSLSSKSDVLSLRDVYMKMLMCTRGLTGDKALEIQKQWKTPREFVEAYEALEEGLENGTVDKDKVERDRSELVFKVLGDAVGRKKVGKALSGKIGAVWGES